METSKTSSYKNLVWIFSILFLASLLAGIYFFIKNDLVTGLLLLIIPFPLIYIGFVFHRPVIGFVSVLFANYFAVGITRYLPAPLGLVVDGLLILTWLAILFSQFNHKVEWKRAWNLLTFLSLVWFSYTLFELVNPEAVSREAWFYAMRGVSFYMVLSIPMMFLIFNRPHHLKLFVKLWAWFTVLAILKGLMQKFVGPDPWEQHWLAVIGGKTHLLAGGLRVFSFFSDAATYGGSMGFSAVFFLVIGLHSDKRFDKLFYLMVAAGAIFAMFISGTRGALAVPLAGFTLYAILSKRIKILVIGSFTILAFFVFLKFTTIGNSNYEIRRFRGGLDSDNDSFQVRVENQKKFRAYLKTRPFGGGIGSAGNWGLRFSPGTFLAETPPDGWYVQIWAEQGIVGLTLHLIILFTIVGSASYIVMFKLKDDKLRSHAMGFTAGIFGVMAASYSSGALGQMPNGIIIYAGMAFTFMMQGWEKEMLELSDKKP
jgi:hypothetical protein